MIEFGYKICCGGDVAVWKIEETGDCRTTNLTTLYSPYGKELFPCLEQPGVTFRSGLPPRDFLPNLELDKICTSLLPHNKFNIEAVRSSIGYAINVAGKPYSVQDLKRWYITTDLTKYMKGEQQ